MGVTSYATVARTAEVEVEDRGSRFLARVERVADEDAARAAVDTARRTHGDARHHCSAFVLGPAADVARSSDDGEPSGTAGAPILEVLQGRGLSDVAVVVTRWFGGVLLGAGGLVRAYGDATRAGLDEAGVLRREERRLLAVTVAHADVGRLENDLRVRDVVVLGTDYAAAATIRLAAPVGQVAELQQLLAALTGGSVAAEEGGTTWVDLPSSP